MFPNPLSLPPPAPPTHHRGHGGAVLGAVPLAELLRAPVLLTASAARLLPLRTSGEGAGPQTALFSRHFPFGGGACAGLFALENDFILTQNFYFFCAIPSRLRNKFGKAPVQIVRVEG